jgi:hypothetical protein
VSPLNRQLARRIFSIETPVGILRRVIWEKGFEEELCVGAGRFKKCVKAGGAVRIVQKDSGYFVELSRWPQLNIR